MQAGRLREIVELWRCEREVTDSGEVSENYKAFGVVRAEVVSQNARRAMANGEELYPTTRVFRLRVPPLLQGGDRIKHNGRFYEVLPPSVSPYERVQTVTGELVNL